MITVNSLHPEYPDISLYTTRLRINKQIPNSYPQLQGKVEAYNKILKNEFLAVKPYQT
jgi:hypothetical protein